MEAKLTRWADRDGKTVRWGNIVMCFRGQEFEETFGTQEQAVERERQANSGEAIGSMREPIAVKRTILH